MRPVEDVEGVVAPAILLEQDHRGRDHVLVDDCHQLGDEVRTPIYICMYVCVYIYIYMLCIYIYIYIYIRIIDNTYMDTRPRCGG